MTTKAVLKVLDQELEEIANKQADITAKGSAADVQLLEIGRVLNDLKRIRQRAESEKKALDTLDKKVVAAYDTYYEAIAPVREALGTGGVLSPEQRASQMDAVRKALGTGESVLEEAMLKSYLTVVRDYDKKSDEAVNTADDAVIHASQELTGIHTDAAAKGARVVYEETKAALEQLADKILELAKSAKAVAAAAKSDLERLERSLDPDDLHPFQAVIHLYDLLWRCEQLEADVFKVSEEDADLKHPPGFGLKQDDGVLFQAIKDVWDGARKTYVEAAKDLFGEEGTEVKTEGKEVVLLTARIALAEAQAQAEHRRTMRLSSAAEEVEEEHSDTNGENGNDDESTGEP